MVALVQAVGPQPGTSLTTLAVTIAATGTGNALVVCSAAAATGATNPAVTGITLGGSATGWASVESVTSTSWNSSEIWWCPTPASGQTAIVITYAGGAGSALTCAYVYEVSGLTGTVDKVAGTGNATGGSPATASSGATATTTAAAEFWAGITSNFHGSANQAFTPIGAWTNRIQQAQSVSGLFADSLSGYQIVSATGAATYSATIISASWSAAVATFTAAATSTPTAVVATGTGAADTASTIPHTVTSSTQAATAASDLGGNYGMWATPQFAEGGP
jgi:hypothetical protein